MSRRPSLSVCLPPQVNLSTTIPSAVFDSATKQVTAAVDTQSPHSSTRSPTATLNQCPSNGMEASYPIIERHGYKLTKFLSRSLYGCVVLAEVASAAPTESMIPTSSPTTTVCIKISHLTFALQHTSPDEVGQLTRVRDHVFQEATILRTMASSPYVVKLIEEFKEDGFHFLITEYAGVELFEVVKSGNLTLEQVRHYTRQLVGAVTHLHSAGIAHVDLTLTNVCVNETTQELKVIDFGIADNGSTPTNEEPMRSHQFPHHHYRSTSIASSYHNFSPKSPVSSSSTSGGEYSLTSPDFSSPVLSSLSTSVTPQMRSLLSPFENSQVPMIDSSDSLHSCRRELFPATTPSATAMKEEDEQPSTYTIPEGFSDFRLVCTDDVQDAPMDVSSSTPTNTTVSAPTTTTDASSTASSGVGAFSSWPLPTRSRRPSLSNSPDRLRSDLPPSKPHKLSPEQRIAVEYHTSNLISNDSTPINWCPFGSDIYSLGVMVFEMLTGLRWNHQLYECPTTQPPFESITQETWSFIQACTQPEAYWMQPNELASHVFLK